MNSLRFIVSLQPATGYWLYAIHPIWMWVVFVMTVYALYLGLQSRRTRMASGEMKKILAKQKFSQRHYRIGALLLALMTTGSIGVLGIEYLNSGKLYVVPHTVVGLVMTALMANAAALVPFMQRGKEWARQVHMVLAFSIMGLFVWQLFTGFSIVWEIVSEYKP
ncbi:DUF4079 domain-containing protein [cf. Phormidesmis sp. LEGE 11477]|uniref:DUF4079 domain-containing protein n=1 Tax=cf. Phormidesmis sp. LEGE 11477 TaxID=1828680 RepID=UPI00187E3495|nr:DUF4079 domain-containing protein [cf. Phormidesmis sp. LEGE 11477]MBE9062461.1 DUF4079 domain-containing protein [cf. Phormidesmis sp. LEGE 11477]